MLPVDVVVADEFSAEANTRTVPVEKIPDGWKGLDIGPESVEAFAQVLASAKTVFWNGPMGVFELAPFAEGTRGVAQAIIDTTRGQGDGTAGFSVVGGGDSAAAVRALGLPEDGFSHISTGGGASLEYLEGKVLPGIAVLEGIDMARRPLIAGNWKMNLTVPEADDLVRKLAVRAARGPAPAGGRRGAAAVPAARGGAAVLSTEDPFIMCGGQDLSPHDKGAHTGDVSGPMLCSVGCRYVTVGHSERRTDHHEDDTLVHDKVAAALRHGLTPILCVGEGLDVREAGNQVAHTLAQVDAALDGVSTGDAAGVVIAYEPVWAIGTARSRRRRTPRRCAGRSGSGCGRCTTPRSPTGSASSTADR